MNDILPGALLCNRTFDELAIGDTASLVRMVTDDDIQLFAAMSGDVNPTHLDAAYAASNMFGHVVVHGMWTGGLISSLLGTQLPGPGTVYLGQDLRFRCPVSPGDTITARVTVSAKHADRHIVVLDTVCTNQHQVQVLNGTATVVAPTTRISMPRAALPDVTVHRHDRFAGYIQQARKLPALVTAVVHPCSPEAISAAVDAWQEGLMVPILVGPRTRIEEAAAQAGVALDGLRIIDAEHSHAAAVHAVALAASGEVDALMKGSLHSNELLEAVVAPAAGLRTGRRVSHVFLLDVPGYPRPLLVTDAAINIAPTLAHKRDICQNAIDFAHRLGIAEPRVAILAAVETVETTMPATLDAAALTVMAQRGQITGAKVDGPLAFDNAISPAAAHMKGIVSPVAGIADILLVPDLEAGNILAKQLVHLSGADAAGLVLGARVPIILTSRADSLRARLASVALARLAGVARPAR